MIRQRVTRHGVIFPLPPSSELPGCTMDRELVGVVKQGPVKKWLDQKQQWDARFASAKRKVHKQFVRDLAVGYEGFGRGELPPPSALAGRRRKKEGGGGGADGARGKKRTKSMGLALWSLWGSKHDKTTNARELEADRTNASVETRPTTAADGEGARPFAELGAQEAVQPASPARAKTPKSPRTPKSSRRPHSRRRRVTYDRQDEEAGLAGVGPGGDGEVAGEGDGVGAAPAGSPQFLSPDVGVGASGRRAYVDGIAVPFRLKGEAETASMMTLTSNVSGQGPQSPRVSTSGPMSSTGAEDGTKGGGEADGLANGNANHEEEGKGQSKEVEPPAGIDDAVTPAVETPFETPATERPELETYATALENLPTIKTPHNQSEVD